jgi:hypothetical protein
MTSIHTIKRRTKALRAKNQEEISVDNNGLEVANRTLPLVLARGEVEVILPLQSRFATRTEEYDEPALSVCEVKAWALAGELFAELTLRQEIYYVSAETGLVEKDVYLHRLSQLFNVPGIEPQNLVEISAEAVPQGNWRVAGSEERGSGVTTLTGDCKVKINYVIFGQEDFAFYQPGADTDGTALAETMEVECFSGTAQGTYDITLPVEFGAIPKTMGDINGGLFNAKATVMPGWVRLEGDVIVTVPYHDVSGAEHEESFVLPIRRYLEFPEAVDGMLAVSSSRVEIFTCRRKPDSKNGQIRGLLHADVRFSTVEALEVATGMRSHFSSFPGHAGHSKNPFLLEEVIAVGSSQTLIQREIVFPRPVRKVREPVDAVVRNLTHEIIGNKVIVRGVLNKQLFAVDAATGAVFAVDVDETFVHFVDVPGAAPGMRAHVTARVEFVSVDIRPGGETARQVTIIEIIVKVTRFIKKEIVSPIFPPVKPFPPHGPLPQPTGTIYTVRSGDSVWKIAQMFGVSMQSIISANNLQNPNLIFPGQKLIIPGR